MSNKITRWLERFHRRVERTNCNPLPAEQVQGKAFSYRVYDFEPVQIINGTITAHINETDGEQFSVSEAIEGEVKFDACSVFRAKEAYGLQNVIGAAFGTRKRT